MKPTTLRWTKLSIWASDNASPADFTSRVCGLNAKGFTISGNMSETNVPDCDDPDAPSWTERVMQALSAGVSGSGILAEESYAFWRQWSMSGLSNACRIVVDLSTAPGYFEGNFLLNSFELAGNQSNGLIEVTLAMSSDGPIEWVTGDPAQ